MSFSFNQRYFTLALPLLIVVTLAVLAGCGSTSAAEAAIQRRLPLHRCLAAPPLQSSRPVRQDHWVVGRCGQRLEFLVLPVDADRESRNNCHF